MSQNLLEEEVGEGNGTGLAMLGIGDVVGGIATDEHMKEKRRNRPAWRP